MQNLLKIGDVNEHNNEDESEFDYSQLQGSAVDMHFGMECNVAYFRPHGFEKKQVEINSASFSTNHEDVGLEHCIRSVKD